MQLPFTRDQFLSVFEQYNLAVWPVQILLNILGLSAVFFAIRKTRVSNVSIAVILGALWLWIGLAYHFGFFASVNPTARVFGIFTVLQGILFLTYGVLRRKLSFHVQRDVFGFTGAILVLYALIVYPILGYSFGHIYPKAPTFGLPCPTTIFTFGLLLWTDARVPKVVLVIPLLWSLIGFSAALTLGILEDTGLLIAGVVGTILIVLRDRRSSDAKGDRTTSE
jgi:hypothetical protein